MKFADQHGVGGNLVALVDRKSAMKNGKAGLKAPTENPGWVKDIHLANERIENLTEANQQLKAVNQQLLARFLTWQANADIHGVSQSMLDRQLVQFRN